MKKLLLIKLALVLAVLSFGVVQAISYYFPNPNSDSNSNKIAAIAYPGSGYALDAPRAEFKLFMVDKTGNNITINNGCNTSSWGWGNDSTIFEPYQNNSSEESVGGPISSKNSWANCTGNDVTFNNISANTKSSVQGREQYYTMTLVARKSNTSGGINGFQVILNNQKNFVSFKELYPSSLVTNTTQPPDKSFSLISKQFSSNPSGENSYHMEFKADCSVTSNLRIYLKWFDADHGRSNDKGTAINFNLYDQTAGSQVTMTAYDGSPETTITGNNIGGQGDYRYARFTIKPDHQYIWRWNGVDNNNGIQLWMPFTETNWNISCGTYDYQPRINIVSDAEVTNGDLITPRLRIRNLTSFDGQLYHGDVISRDNSDNIEYTSSPSPTSGYSEWGNKNYRWANPRGVS